jgi:hypothetical protein
MEERQPGALSPGSGHEAEPARARWLRAGVLAGVACVVACAVLLLAIDLIPSRTTRDLFATGSGNPLEVGLARDALSAWNGQYGRPSSDSQEPSLSTSGLVFGGVLVLTLVLFTIGLVVKRRVAPSLRARCLALLAAGLVCAALTAAIAAADRYTLGGVRYTHDPLVYAVSALVLTLAIGGFAFGIVALLPRVVAAALRRAALFVGLSFVVAGLLFRVFVAAGHVRPGSRTEHFAHASTYSAAIGGMTIPLALQAPVSTDMTMAVPFAVAADVIGPPGFDNIYDPAPVSFPWDRLALTISDHPHARLARYAASLGPWGTATGIVLTMAVVAGLVATTVGLCRRLRPPAAVGALVLGVFQGACIALLATLLAGLSGFVVTAGAPADMTALWGVPMLSLFYTAAVAMGLCGITGLAFGLATRKPEPDRPPCAATGVTG